MQETLTVRVRLFAMMAQHAGTGNFSLAMAPGTAVRDVQQALQARFPALPWPPGTMIAVNQEYGTADQVLREGDEVAVIPPVSGGTH